MDLTEVIGCASLGLATLGTWGIFDQYKSLKIEALGNRLVREWEKTSLRQSDCPSAVGLLSFCERGRYQRLYRDIKRFRGY